MKYSLVFKYNVINFEFLKQRTPKLQLEISETTDITITDIISWEWSQTDSDTDYANLSSNSEYNLIKHLGKDDTIPN